MESFSSVSSATELCVKVIGLCFDYSKDVKNAVNEIQHVRQAAINLQHLMESLEQLRSNSKATRLKNIERVANAIHEAQLLLQKLFDDLAPGKRQKAMSKIGVRALKWPFEKHDIQNRIAQIEQCMQLIRSSMQVDQTKILLDLDLKALLDSLPIASEASFDSFEEARKPKCLPGTRVELLHEISKWAKGSDTHALFWLNGMAGTGKSTISRTVAETAAASGSLGATFFFKRGEADRGGLLKFFTTIAADFIQRLPTTASFIQEAINIRPAIIRSFSQDQFDLLIFGPLSKIPQDCGIKDPIIIIVDALDECDQDDVRLLIRLFSRFQKLKFPKIKAFLTSRPELPPRLGFQDINGAYDSLILHEVAAPTVGKDISKFLTHELSKILDDYNSSVPERRKLPGSWPGDEHIQTLVEMAIPLFIFASTMCRFIGDRRCGNPQSQLELVLRYQTKYQESQINATYLPVLHQQTNQLPPQLKEKVVKEFRMIVGSIIILADPLSITTLSRLLQVSEDTIDARLEMLHSVLSIPLSADESVRLLHLSFRDFLLDSEIRDQTPLWVDEKQAHASIADHCLRVLNKQLKRDMCDLKAPGTSISEIKLDIVDKHMMSELQYSCLYWVHHVQESGIKLVDNDQVHKFLLCHFLHWLEALSLIREMRQVIIMVRELQTLIEPQSGVHLSEFLIDAQRFVRINVSDVESWPLQIYNSALVFAPLQSAVKTEYKDEMPSWLSFTPSVDQRWDSCLQIFEGHNDAINCIDFSNDSTLIISASNDCTIRLWDVDTGECLQELREHAFSVESVKFSHNCSLILSASTDKTIRLWRTDTGDCVRIFTGHTNYITSAAFSHDSKFIVSGSWDNSVRIWDTDTGNCVHEIFNECKVIVVEYSHNSTLIAGGRSDGAIYLWDADDGTRKQILQHGKEEITSVAFSNDTSLVVSGSIEKYIKIWKVTGECVRTIKVRSGYNVVALSHDSTFLAAAGGSGILYVWRTHTGECIQRHICHDKWVTSLVFSHDLTSIASASYDGTVRLWETMFDTQGKIQQQFEQATFSHSLDFESTIENDISPVRFLSISQDSTLVASSAWFSHIVKIWSTDNGRCIQQLRYAHPLEFVSVFSYDSSQLLCITVNGTVYTKQVHTGDCVVEFDISEDVKQIEGRLYAVSRNLELLAVTPASFARSAKNKNIHLWRLDTGRPLYTLVGHIDFVRHIAFSNNCAFMASVSKDGLMHMWDLDTGKCRHKLQCTASDPTDPEEHKIVFSCNSNLVALATSQHDSSWPKLVHSRIFDVRTGECVHYSKNDRNRSFGLNSMTLSPDFSIMAIKLSTDTMILRMETGEVVQTISTEPGDDYVQLDIDKHRLITNTGVLDAFQSQIDKRIVCHSSGYSLSSDKSWIMWNESNLLRLPPSYQPRVVDFRGSTFAFGYIHGRIVIISLSKERFPEF